MSVLEVRGSEWEESCGATVKAGQLAQYILRCFPLHQSPSSLPSRRGLLNTSASPLIRSETPTGSDGVRENEAEKQIVSDSQLMTLPAFCAHFPAPQPAFSCDGSDLTLLSLQVLTFLTANGLQFAKYVLDKKNPRSLSRPSSSSAADICSSLGLQ